MASCWSTAPQYLPGGGQKDPIDSAKCWQRHKHRYDPCHVAIQVISKCLSKGAKQQWQCRASSDPGRSSPSTTTIPCHYMRRIICSYHSNRFWTQNLVDRERSVESHIRQDVHNSDQGAGDGDSTGQVPYRVLQLLYDEVQIIPANTIHNFHCACNLVCTNTAEQIPHRDWYSYIRILHLNKI